LQIHAQNRYFKILKRIPKKQLLKEKTENGFNTDLEFVLFLLEELLLGLGQFLVYALHEERRVRLHAQRIHHSVYQSSGTGSSISSESGSGSRVLMTKNLKEEKILMKNLLEQKLQFTYVHATGKDCIEHTALQEMKFINCFLC
jgi:hypothetical protein